MSGDESIWSRCSPLIRIFPLPLIPMSLQTLTHFSALPPLGCAQPALCTQVFVNCRSTTASWPTILESLLGASMRR